MKRVKKVIFYLKILLMIILIAFVPITSLAEDNYSASDQFSVQISACTHKESAEKIIADLTKIGYSPYLFKIIDKKKQAWYLVRLGNFKTFDQASKIAKKFTKNEKKEAVITRADSMHKINLPRKISTAQTIGEVKTLPKITPPAAAPPVSNSLPIKAGTAADQALSDLPLKQPDDTRFQELQTQIKALQDKVQDLRDQADVRKKLEISDEEKTAEEKEVLSAAGRDYTLMKQGIFGLEYNFAYSYYSFDVLTEAINVEQRSNHSLINSISMEYAMWDNFTTNLIFPFVYKYDKIGTDDEKDVSDIGDVSLGFQYQPFKTDSVWPATIFTSSYKFDWGRSPYEIIPEEELATGSGYATANVGLSFSKTVDPIIAFGNLSYAYNFTKDGLDQKRRNGLSLEKVEPGDRLGFTVGMGFALSYNVSLNFSFQYSHQLNTKYYWSNDTDTDSGARTSSVFSIGSGWRLSPKQSISFKLGIGLTDEDPDFTFSFRIPFEFNLI